MNLIKILYCCRYFDLKKQGKEHTARASGTTITAILFFLLFLSAFLLLIIYYPNFEVESTKFIEKYFGKTAAKGISKLILVLFFGGLYFLIKKTAGSLNIYNKTIEEFSLLSQYEQERMKKIGNIYFLIPIFLYITTMILLMNN